MLSYRDILNGFRSLEIDSNCPIIVHASLRAFGEVRGGVDTLLGVLLQLYPRLMAPAHTYLTMIAPEDGPENNGMTYGSGDNLNRMAEFYKADMPCDRLMGALPEALRRHPNASRSDHPILSFTGIGVRSALEKQTLDDPFTPIGALAEEDGWVLLLGVDHTVNTSMHYAEKLAGRRQFIRWALANKGVVECKGFPGCSLGFEKAAPRLADMTRRVKIGSAEVRSLPLRPMFERVIAMIRENEEALLCDDPECERCAATRMGGNNNLSPALS
jgi:aminoglycoside 3-N-acetyltransferase